MAIRRKPRRTKRARPAREERYALPFIRIHARCGFRGCLWPATAVWAVFGGGRRYQFLVCGGCASMLFMASRKADATAAEIAELLEGPPLQDPTITIMKHRDDK